MTNQSLTLPPLFDGLRAGLIPSHQGRGNKTSYEAIFFEASKKMNKNNSSPNFRKSNVRDRVAYLHLKFCQDFPEWYKKTLRTLFKTSFLNKTI